MIQDTTKKLFTISAKNVRTVTSWMNMIGIRVKKTLLDSAMKSSFLVSVVELIIECEETFEYNSHSLSRSEQCVRVKNTMKSTIYLVKENSILVVSKSKICVYDSKPLNDNLDLNLRELNGRCWQHSPAVLSHAAYSWVLLFQLGNDWFSAGIRMSGL